MNEITLDGKAYISSKQAAEITGYAKDYIGQLCREGRIEARLVGRNWYVLESAIRAHRFGKAVESEQGESEPAQINSWANPRYIAEEPAVIPPLSERKSVNDLTGIGKDSAPVAADMQSAWQEWFSMREAAQQPTESATESFVAPEPTPVIEEVRESEGEEEVPITIRTILEEPEPEEPSRAFDLVRSAPISYEPVETRPEREVSLEDEIQPKRRFPQPSALIIKSVFVAIALISIAVTVVGTGFGQKLGNLTLYRLSEIQFIAGVSAFNK